MTIRIGYWDCPSCGNKKNLGPNPTCANCGRPRGANIPFYTDDSAPVVEDPEMVARARAGADWTCKYCNADNRAGNMDCHRCGAGPDGSVRRNQQFVANAPAPAVRAATLSPAKKSSTGRVLAIVGAIFALLFGVWFFFLRTTTLQVTVESAAWVKTAQLEERQTKQGAAWHDKVPDGAKVLGKETRQRSKQVQEGTKKVKVGQKDLGNGMFEDIYKEEPNMMTKDVDDAWIRYEVYEWVETEKLEEKTNDGREPRDPTFGLSTNATKRVGATSNDAVFTLKGNDGKSYTFEVDASQAGAAAVKKYDIGKTYTAEVNGLGQVRALSP